MGRDRNGNSRNNGNSDSGNNVWRRYTDIYANPSWSNDRAAALVGVNGVATTIEAGTNYNFMRDGLFGEVLQLDESAYNTYETVTDIVMSVGTTVLGIYHMTGQYKAAKYGQKFLGKRV